MSVGMVWFRRDLRLADNPAWSDATRRHRRVVPLFVVDPHLWNRCSPRRVTLLAAHLRALDERLGDSGGRLHVVVGDPVEVVPRVVERFRADEVFFNRDVTPYARARDSRIQAPTVVHEGCFVLPPGSVTTRKGALPQTFASFHRAWTEAEWDLWPEPGDGAPTDDPGDGVPPSRWEGRAGEEAAERASREFLGRIDRYETDRDRLDVDPTSHLSTDLKFGTLDARRLVVEARTAGGSEFVRQVAWRDYLAHLMWFRPDLVTRSFDPRFDRIGWLDDPEALEAWKTGHTGYPLVDAGMRQLLAEGWIPNRVRMVTASFLVKNLGIDWRLGERWFRRHLLDGDVSQNVGNWQWVAGIGLDRAPYFRILNPVLQSRRHDPAGRYIRRWVPELGNLPDRYVHTPWLAPEPLLRGAYPAPIVDLRESRTAALQRYRAALDREVDR
jgi:deoxyribodipyrimidine photo-lyase